LSPTIFPHFLPGTIFGKDNFKTAPLALLLRKLKTHHDETPLLFASSSPYYGVESEKPVLKEVISESWNFVFGDSGENPNNHSSLKFN